MNTIEQMREQERSEGYREDVIKNFIATSITTGGKQVFRLSEEQYKNVHNTHPAWCCWREVKE